MSPKRPVKAEPVSAERWWGVKKFPTGAVLLTLDPRKLRPSLVGELGFTAAGIGLTVWAMRSVSPALALASTIGQLATAGRSLYLRLPTRWWLKPGRAILEDRRGKRRTYVPARVIVMRKEHPAWDDDGRMFNRTSHVTYALFVETVDGKKIAVHRGLPYRDRVELARAMADALRVEWVEREWFGLHVGPLIVTST